MAAILAILTTISPALYTAAGAIIVLLINKFLPSVTEKSSNKREDFDSITSALFQDIRRLQEEQEESKREAKHCATQYKELQDKFTDFKHSYNELKLRYDIQLNINKRLREDIELLEREIKSHIEKEKLKIVYD